MFSEISQFTAASFSGFVWALRFERCCPGFGFLLPVSLRLRVELKDTFVQISCDFPSGFQIHLHPGHTGH